MSHPDSEAEIISPIDPERAAVVLPCEPHQFREFISGLLGKPQVIDRTISGPFCVAKSDIEDLFILLDQRVSSQNDSTLIQFTARIFYKDNSSVLLNSFSDFASYKEVKPLVSTAVQLGWTYLIKFRNKNVHEKQQIDVGFLGDPHRRLDLDEFRFRSMEFRNSGFISLRISHTDRTWGTDIEALLSGHLTRLVRQQSPLRSFARRYSTQIGFLTFAALICSFLYGGWIALDDYKDQVTRGAREVLRMDFSQTATIASATKEILQRLVDSPNERLIGISLFGFLLALGVSAILATMVGEYASERKPSFVALTDKTIELRDATLSRDWDNWFFFVCSILGSIILSVLGNYAFYLIVKRFLE
ncbi:hypothetical protein [Rhodopseudomonas palustris]|nr:hypothetical protein [Rhodopseudomonas palustris]